MVTQAWKSPLSNYVAAVLDSDHAAFGAQLQVSLWLLLLLLLVVGETWAVHLWSAGHAGHGRFEVDVPVSVPSVAASVHALFPSTMQHYANFTRGCTEDAAKQLDAAFERLYSCLLALMPGAAVVGMDNGDAPSAAEHSHFLVALIAAITPRLVPAPAAASAASPTSVAVEGRLAVARTVLAESADLLTGLLAECSPRNVVASERLLAEFPFPFACTETRSDAGVRPVVPAPGVPSPTFQLSQVVPVSWLSGIPCDISKEIEYRSSGSGGQCPTVPYVLWGQVSPSEGVSRGHLPLAPSLAPLLAQTTAVSTEKPLDVPAIAWQAFEAVITQIRRTLALSGPAPKQAGNNTDTTGVVVVWSGDSVVSDSGADVLSVGPASLSKSLPLTADNYAKLDASPPLSSASAHKLLNRAAASPSPSIGRMDGAGGESDGRTCACSLGCLCWSVCAGLPAMLCTVQGEMHGARHSWIRSRTCCLAHCRR